MVARGSRQPVIRHRDEVPAVDCPCGQSTRIITAADGASMSLHVTEMLDGEAHLHELADEIYYIIEGEGYVELDGDTHPVRAGSAVHIPAGVTHRGWGGFTAVVIVDPPFDPDDEIIVGRRA